MTDKVPSGPIRFPSYLLPEYFFINLGKKLLRTRIPVKEYRVQASVLKGLLSGVENYIFDNVIIYTDYGSFTRIVEHDWTSAIKYYSEAFDCDNYAVAFATHVNEVWGLNNVGIAIGTVVDADTGEVKTVHSWNVVLLHVSGEPMLFMFEPQAKILFPYENPKIKNLIYKVSTIIWW